MGLQIGGDAIIRLLRKSWVPDTPFEGTITGVDDFAYRKGHTYCTVICDGETHRPLDVLEGRDGTALKEWLLKNKSHIKAVTRDRASAYAKVISEVLPEAMQVADRFHLHHNLLKAVKESLKSELPARIEIPNEPPENSSEQESPAQQTLQESNAPEQRGEKICAVGSGEKTL
jgi:transposase